MEKKIEDIINNPDIKKVNLDLKLILNDNYLLKNEISKFKNSAQNTFDKKSFEIKNEEFIKNNLKFLNTEKYMIVKKELKAKKITKNNYVKHVLFKILKKQNDFLENKIEEDDEDDDDEENRLINNIDILFLIYEYADIGLREILVKNINLCYKGIPFISKNHNLYLYNLFYLKSEWYEKKNENDDEFICFKNYIMDIRKPKIFFFKSGNEKTDKSEIINNLFFDKKEIFQKIEEKCIYAKGAVEFQITKTEKKFGKHEELNNELFLIFNMRGNSEENYINRNFVIENSEILVFFSEYIEDKIIEIEKAIKKNKLVIHLILKKKKLDIDKIQEFVDKYPELYKPKKILKKTKISQIINFIKRNIKDYLPKIKKKDLKNLKELIITEKKIKSDLNFNIIKNSKIYVKNTLDYLESDNNSKNQIQKIYEEKIILEKKIRRQNFDKNHFNQDKRNSSKKISILNVKLKNIISNDKIHQSVKNFIEIFLKLNQENLSVYLNMLNNQLSRKSLMASNLSLENNFKNMNYFREMIYYSEIILDQKIQNGDFISKLTNKFVDLMLKGQYVELINGNCCGFNVNFFKILFKKLENRLGKKNFFILSTLGLQSSGKSTMLNTMFNLDFSVGIGRCTKGINMQLLKMDPKLKKKNSCDYILILDTEGLRSTEQMNGNIEKDYKRDNELSTFIAGISDLTILNIMGLNDPALLEILQIVISAFVKIKKKDDINNKWIFMHQNINSSEAELKKNEQYKNIIKSLDTVTEIVSEKYDANFKKFTDLVDFNQDEDIYLISTFKNQFSISKSYVNDIFNVKNKIIKY